MTIDQILNDKGFEVISVADKDTLQDAAKVLDAKRIGAVVALAGNGEIIGVLSERDIMRRMAREGAAALTMTVAEAMTRDVVTVESTTSVDNALQIMTDRRIRHLPIMRGGKLSGFVSIGDLVKWKIAETVAEAEAMKSYISS